MARARAELSNRIADPARAIGAGSFWGTTPADDLPQRVVAAKVSTWSRLKEIWEARELVVFLVRKELKVRYKNSFLGFLWTYLNPALVLLIYYVMFSIVLKNGIQDFAIYLMCGLLPWNVFNTALLSSSGTLVSHAAIVKKVAFPREVLALAQVGVATCYFFFQSVILVAFLVGFRVMPDWRYLPVMVLAFVADIIFTAALALILSSLNVYMRDIEHFVQVLMVALFFGEPIVYTWSNLGVRLAQHGLEWLYLLNPLTPIVMGFQRFLYANVSGAMPRVCAPNGTQLVNGKVVGCGVVSFFPEHWYFEILGIVLAVSLVLFYLAMRIFSRVEANFAEEL